uniref:Uncharacterized protein n=1 Tax=Ditylenchus dipsaci TaxID=166011 RepID=A0A915ELH2_9BILA
MKGEHARTQMHALFAQLLGLIKGERDCQQPPKSVCVSRKPTYPAAVAADPPSCSMEAEKLFGYERRESSPLFWLCIEVVIVLGWLHSCSSFQ